MLDVFNRQLHHVPPTVIVKMVYHASKVNVKHVVAKTMIVIATNDVKMEIVNHYAEETMTVDTVKCARTLFVQLDAVQMRIALAIWHVLDKSVWIHA